MSNVETVDVTKPKEMIGGLFVGRDGVLYRCRSYDAETGTYTLKGFVDDTKAITCLYSVFPNRFTLIRSKRMSKASDYANAKRLFFKAVTSQGCAAEELAYVGGDGELVLNKPIPLEIVPEFIVWLKANYED